MLKIGPENSRRERNKRSKLQRIEASARRLFRERGYDETTTRAIAEGAGIAVGTLFVYFPEKLDLLVHLYKEDLERVANGALDAIAPGTPLVGALCSVFDAIYRFYEDDTTLARTFVKELMFLDLGRQAGMVNVTIRVIERLAALVAAAQERGEVRQDVPVPLAAHQIFGLYYWGLVMWLAGAFPARETVSSVLRMELELVMRGLAAPKE